MSNSEYLIPESDTVNCGDIRQAIYREPEISDYVGNPLIEALPAISTTEQAAEDLALYPNYNEKDRDLPSNIRQQKLQIRLRFFAPLNVHLDLERRFSSMIRVGYIGRNPTRVGFWNDVTSRVESIRSISVSRRYQLPSSAPGFNIIGMSGVGKSYSVSRILSFYPQVIHHSHYGDRNFTLSQVTWLKLDCPFDGNTKGLCIEFFKAIDNILGTNYLLHYAGRYRIQDELMSSMSRVAANHCMGVLIIDEIQRLKSARSGGDVRMLNFFVQLINTIGVPVVLIGNFKALDLLTGDFSQMRRGTGQGDLIWRRMEQDEQWQLFVESLWRFQYTRKRCALKDNPALGDVLYDVTQGVTDFAVKVYMFAQELAIDSKKEEVTEAIIRSAAQRKLELPPLVLNAIRRDDWRALAMYEDAYDRILHAHNHVQTNERGDKIVSPAATEQPSKAMPESSPQPSAVSDVLASKQSKQKKQATTPASTIGVFPQIVRLAAKQNGGVYKALKENGYLRPFIEFFPADESVSST